jgi:hypothetical protein
VFNFPKALTGKLRSLAERYGQTTVLLDLMTSSIRLS